MYDFLRNEQITRGHGPSNGHAGKPWRRYELALLGQTAPPAEPAQEPWWKDPWTLGAAAAAAIVIGIAVALDDD